MRTLARVGTGLMLTLASACGLSTKHVAGSGDDAGGAAGESTVTHTGGTGTPGAGGTGNRAGTGGSNPNGGAAGSDAVCTLTPVFEPCEALGGFYHDPQTNECLHTVSFQCGSGPNGFRTLADCLASCPTAKPGMTTCDLPADCAVVSAGCCGLCPSSPLDAAQALNGARLSDRPLCGDVSCEPCPPADETTSRTQNYVPICVNGSCSVEDVSGSPSARCASDSDCHLRDGADCCEQCDGTGLVALSSEELLSADVCSGASSCSSCAHSYTGYRARCQYGYCHVAFADTSSNGGSDAGGSP